MSPVALKQTKSAGILATILNCGVIVSISVLLGTESLSQVYMHLSDLYREHQHLPHQLCYDDGCHLRRFIELRQDPVKHGKFAAWFWENVGQKIKVDRFHFKNHKKSHTYCQKHCNPNTLQDGLNTEVCEQSFRWVARLKYSLNSMTPVRFIFFLHIAADIRNKMLLDDRASKLENSAARAED